MKAAESTAPAKPAAGDLGAFDPAATAAAEARTGPRSPIVKFKANFDYTWPSRSVTAFKAGWQGRVKGEVAAAAEAAGVLESSIDGDGNSQ